MKKFFKNTAVRLFGAKIHATHRAIKGNKSGGNRDNSGKDWYKPS